MFHFRALFGYPEDKPTFETAESGTVGYIVEFEAENLSHAQAIAHQFTDPHNGLHSEVEFIKFDTNITYMK